MVGCGGKRWRGYSSGQRTHTHKGRELKANKFYSREENKSKRMQTVESVSGVEGKPTGV